MQITRLRSTADIGQVAQALADLIPHQRAHNRFAIISARGESSTHHFLVEAAKGEKSWELLKTAGRGVEATFTVNGTTELTGRVECLFDGRSKGVWTTSYFARTLGFAGSTALGFTAAAYAMAGTLQFGTGGTPQAVMGILGLLAGVGALFSVPRLFAETSTNWAATVVDNQREGGAAEAIVKRVENGEPIKPIAALPAPSESPMIIPSDLVRPAAERVAVR